MIIYSLTWDVLEMWCPVYVLTLMHAIHFKEIFMLGKRGVTKTNNTRRKYCLLPLRLKRETIREGNTVYYRYVGKDEQYKEEKTFYYRYVGKDEQYKEENTGEIEKYR